VFSIEEAMKIIIDEIKLHTGKLCGKLVFVNEVGVFATVRENERMMSGYWHPTRSHTATCVLKMKEVKELRILKKAKAEAGHWAIAWSSYINDNNDFEKKTFYNTL